MDPALFVSDHKTPTKNNSSFLRFFFAGKINSFFNLNIRKTCKRLQEGTSDVPATKTCTVTVPVVDILFLGKPVFLARLMPVKVMVGSNEGKMRGLQLLADQKRPRI
jgi:hypothetical protein